MILRHVKLYCSVVDLDTGQLAALAAVVAAGTFEAAAAHLHITPSAVSQRIRALETTTGRVLLVRGKPVRPTPSGEVVLRAARQLALLSADVAAELAGEGGAAVEIAVAVNADSLATWVLPALAPQGDRVRLDLRREDEHRTSMLLRAGSVMAAITTESAAVTGCTVRRLGAMRYRATATAAFAARWFPQGPTPSALAEAPVVVFDRSDPLQHRWLRRRTGRDLDPPAHHVPGSGAFVEAVRRGLGWGMLPDQQSASYAGEFVDLDPGRHLDVVLYWQQWRLRAAALELVADAVVAGAAVALHVAESHRRPPRLSGGDPAGSAP